MHQFAEKIQPGGLKRELRLAPELAPNWVQKKKSLMKMILTVAHQLAQRIRWTYLSSTFGLQSPLEKADDSTPPFQESVLLVMEMKKGHLVATRRHCCRRPPRATQ